MEFSDISNIRLSNQNLTIKKETSPKQLIEYLGAIQGQDFHMSKWAMGARLNNITENEIETAFNNGEILRTHVLRPTWHIVSPKDIRWMLKLTAPHIRSNSGSRHRELELNNKTLSKIYRLIEIKLRDNNHLTRDELYSVFHNNKISTDDNRGAHILMCAELEGLICNGIKKGNKQTYALLDERVPEQVQLTRDEALENLARTYFLSRGPATLRDFIWWSGLPVRDARKALKMISSELIEKTIGEESLYLSKNFDFSLVQTDAVQILPAFDEYLIAYTDRKAVINDEINKKAISNNGVFRPIVVVNGKVVGIWRRTTKKDKVVVEVDLFKSLKKSNMKLLEKEFELFGTFLGKEIVYSK